MNSLGVYLGIKGFGTANIKSKPDVPHLFFIDGLEKEYLVSSSNNFSLQNMLQVGYIYHLESDEQMITSLELLSDEKDCILSGTIDSISNGALSIDQKPISIDQSVKIYKINEHPGGCYVTEDELHEGDTVKIVLNNRKPQMIFKTFISKVYNPPIKGTPGLLTLKNFLMTALTPVGTTLYVFGGGWNWQDANSSNQAMHIGIPQTWVDFFNAHDANYAFKNTDDPAKSYYMYRDIIQYYYCGLDCSAFVGWCIYNLVENKSSSVSNSAGYGCHSTMSAKILANKGWGTWTRDLSDGFKPGDIFSIEGHVWISLGTCDDGSILLVHSSPSVSRVGQPGAGVQISAVNPKDTGNDCEAYKLASRYMSKYYPEWSRRYEAFLNDYERYTTVPLKNKNAGKFTWDVTGEKLLSDEEGFFKMKPKDILANLFGEL